MPKYRATGPDGRIYQVEAPDEATARQHIARASRPRGYSEGAGARETMNHGFTLGLNDEVQGAGAGVGNVISDALGGRLGAPNIEGLIRGRGRRSIGDSYLEGYQKESDRSRSFRDQFQRERPIAGTGLEIAGGLGSAAAGGTPSNSWRSTLGQGAILGGIYGAATGVTPEERVQGAAVSAPLGAATAGAVRVLGNTVGEGVNLLRRRGLTPEQRATRMLDRGLRRGGMTPEDLDVNRRRLGAGAAEETIAEIGGQPLQAMARAVGNVDGPGRQIAATALERRALRIPNRVMREATRSTDMSGEEVQSLPEAVDALKRARSGQGRRDYAAAYAEVAEPEAVRMHLEPLMRAGPKEAAASAMRQADTETLRLQAKIARARANGANANDEELASLSEEMQHIATARKQLDAIHTGADVETISPRAADLYQRGLRQMSETAGAYTQEGSALGGAVSTFNELSDRIYPALGKARSANAQSRRVEEAMDLGGTLLNKSDGEVRLAMQGASPAERDGLVLGLLNALEQKIGANDTGFVARFAKNKNWHAVLSEGMGDLPAKRLINRIRREALMQAFKNYVTGGSRTTPLADDIRMLTEGESELSFMSEFINSGGNVKNWALRKAIDWWNRSAANAGIRDPAVNEALSQMLYSKASGGRAGNVAKVRARIAALPRYANNPSPAGTALAPGLSRSGDRR